MSALGWVIVNEDGQLFAGYKHPGTRKQGFPVWVKSLYNTNFDGGHAAVYNSAKEANDVRLGLYSRDGVDATVKPVGLLEETAQGWENFQEAFPDQEYSDVLDDRAITELLETSSVTVTVKGRKFVLWVSAAEEPATVG